MEGFIDCPANYSNASFAYKVPDNSMYPLIEKDSFVFVEQNTVLSNKDIGLFFYNGNYLLRRLIYKRGKFALKADNSELKDINISNSDTFYIVGKIYV